METRFWMNCLVDREKALLYVQYCKEHDVYCEQSQDDEFVYIAFYDTETKLKALNKWILKTLYYQEAPSVDKMLNDILEEENGIIESICELNRSLSKAEMKQERLFELWERSNDDMLRPHIELNIAEITVMRKQQQVNDQELSRIRKRLSDCVRHMIYQKDFENSKYFKPVKREDITSEEAKELFIKANEKRKRSRRGVKYRKMSHSE